MNNNIWVNLLVSSLKQILICTILVIFCYNYVDIPVARAVELHHLNHYRIFYWLFSIPDKFFVIGLPIALCGTVVYRAFKPLPKLAEIWFYISVTFVAGITIKEQLKHLFGRAWPKTWTQHNLSLIHDNVYGFFFSGPGKTYTAFPSGHTFAITIITTFIWMLWPRLRPLAVVITLLMVTGLLGMNFHFVGDIVGGFFLGIIVARYGYHVAKMDELINERAKDEKGKEQLA